VARKNAGLLPRDFDLGEMGRDLASHDAVVERMVVLSNLMERVRDTDLALGSDAMVAALEAYAHLKVAGKAEGGTVNDALLAAVAGMLRRYLESAGAPVDRELVALVPVSVRRGGDEGGNHISTVLVDLPVAEPDPRARIAAIHATMAEIKDSAAVRAGALLVGASGWAPPLVSSTLARAMGGVRAFNLVVSNVPGPQQPFWLNGCRLLAVHPAVPLNPSTQGLTVGIVSYDGSVCFGLLADRDLDPPLTVAADGLRAALTELTAA
jgi:WS/DGAT/MGAT family acyltransferase